MFDLYLPYFGMKHKVNIGPDIPKKKHIKIR